MIKKTRFVKYIEDCYELNAFYDKMSSIFKHGSVKSGSNKICFTDYSAKKGELFDFTIKYQTFTSPIEDYSSYVDFISVQNYAEGWSHNQSHLVLEYESYNRKWISHKYLNGIDDNVCVKDINRDDILTELFNWMVIIDPEKMKPIIRESRLSILGI